MISNTKKYVVGQTHEYERSVKVLHGKVQTDLHFGSNLTER